MIQGAIFAQKHMVIKDADTHRPLPYATAECFARQWGSYSDSVGRMILPDSIWNNCSLVFSFVGYASKTTKLNPSLREISLAKLQHKLEDVVLKPCRKFTQEKLRMRSKEDNFSFVYPSEVDGIFCATYIPNKTAKRALIQSISYGVQRGNVTAPVRFRFYEFDSATGLPSTEITEETIIVVPGRTGWITDNIAKYNVVVPETGIVVAFEMFDAGPQYHYIETVHLTIQKTREVSRYGWWIKGMHGAEVIGFGKKPGSPWFKWSVHKKAGDKQTGAAPQVGLLVKLCGN